MGVAEQESLRTLCCKTNISKTLQAYKQMYAKLMFFVSTERCRKKNFMSENFRKMIILSGVPRVLERGGQVQFSVQFQN